MSLLGFEEKSWILVPCKGTSSADQTSRQVCFTTIKSPVLRLMMLVNNSSDLMQFNCNMHCVCLRVCEDINELMYVCLSEDMREWLFIIVYYSCFQMVVVYGIPNISNMFLLPDYTILAKISKRPGSADGPEKLSWLGNSVTCCQLKSSWWVFY